MFSDAEVAECTNEMPTLDLKSGDVVFVAGTVVRGAGGVARWEAQRVVRMIDSAWYYGA